MTNEEKLGPFPHEVALDPDKKERPPVFTPPGGERRLPHEEVRTDIGKRGEAKSTVPESRRPAKPL
jgi:hypothetical protein